MIVYLGMPGKVCLLQLNYFYSKNVLVWVTNSMVTLPEGKHQLYSLLIPGKGSFLKILASSYFLYFTSSLTILLKELKICFIHYFLIVIMRMDFSTHTVSYVAGKGSHASVF